jgi:nucleobase:cation symporter-1, NCS1 family
VIRKAHYDVESFFVPDGIYGKVACRGLLAYAIGLAAEWPFVWQPDYTGLLVAKRGGSDISWIVGWVVAAAVYLLLMRGSSRSEPVRVRAVGTTRGTELV